MLFHFSNLKINKTLITNLLAIIHIKLQNQDHQPETNKKILIHTPTNLLQKSLVMEHISREMCWIPTLSLYSVQNNYF